MTVRMSVHICCSLRLQWPLLPFPSRRLAPVHQLTQAPTCMTSHQRAFGLLLQWLAIASCLLAFTSPPLLPVLPLPALTVCLPVLDLPPPLPALALPLPAFKFCLLPIPSPLLSLASPLLAFMPPHPALVSPSQIRLLLLSALLSLPQNPFHLLLL